MSMQKAQRQMPASAGREAVGQGEAMSDAFSDEAFCPRHATGDTGSALLQATLTTENLRRAFNSRRWWRNSDRLLKTVMTIAYFDRLGVPRLT